MKPKTKVRLDVLLVNRGLAPSRERAQSLILAGKVLLQDNPKVKPGQLVDDDALVRVKEEDHPYVSRGGIKLNAAIHEFNIPVSDRIALDVGASTGGFSHVLLLGGIKKIYAVDVGFNQMDWKIRTDPRVHVFEKINARSMPFDLIGEKVDIIVVDVSFISLEKILPALTSFARPETDWVTLIKPQFEVGKEKVGRGGIVSSADDQLKAVERVTAFAKTVGLNRHGLLESPITGTDGNREFLAYWKMS